MGAVKVVGFRVREYVSISDWRSVAMRRGSASCRNNGTRTAWRRSGSFNVNELLPLSDRNTA